MFKSEIIVKTYKYTPQPTSRRVFDRKGNIDIVFYVISKFEFKKKKLEYFELLEIIENQRII
jgi:hypothetical protein